MLVDADGQLRWASASDQTAQTLEDGQERLAQGPCAVALSQRLPAAIRNLHTEPDWAEFTQVLVGEGSRPCRLCRAGGQPAQCGNHGPGQGRLAAQLEAALEHRWLIEQANGALMGREQVDARAAFERLRGAARSSARRLADVARDVTAGQPLSSSRRQLAKTRAEQAKDKQTAT